MYKQDLALNNQQRLICHKPNQFCFLNAYNDEFLLLYDVINLRQLLDSFSLKKSLIKKIGNFFYQVARSKERLGCINLFCSV